MRKEILIFICFLYSGLLMAQGDIESLRFGDEAYNKKDYLNASFYYRKVIENTVGGKKEFIAPYDMHTYYKIPVKKKNTESSNKNSVTDSSSSSASDGIYEYVVSQLAECYRLIHAYDNAETYYEKSVKVNDEPMDHYWYGQMLMRNEKYTQAALELENFMNVFKDVESKYYKKAERDRSACEIAASDPPDARGVFITKMDTVINKGATSFAAGFFTDTSTLVFSNEKNAAYIQDDNLKELVSLDLYTTSWNGKNWESAVKLPEPVNTIEHEGAASAASSEDVVMLFFTRCTKDGSNECAIYMSRYTSGRWFAPMKLNSNVNLAGSRSMHPSISKDGRVLYFVSDRPGGKGGLDIWACRLDTSGNAQQAFNLGERINTTEDEQTPFYHEETSALYFSTEGRTGFGGLDIFKSTGMGINWSIPLNLGKPINSGKDDAYFILDKTENSGFLSSDRKKCISCEGGNCYEIYKVKNDPVRITISGKVINKETNEVIPNSLVTITDPENPNDPVFVVTDDLGEYTFAAKENASYQLKGQKVKYFSNIDTVTIGNVTETQDFNHDIYLKPVIEGEEIVIPGIEYDYNKANLRPASEDILDEFLLPLLEINANMNIEIGSHTDVRGGDEYNLKLSEARAKSVVDYLISKGIDKDRLTWKGYGETKTLIENAETEEEHQRNRRTAFKVISSERPKAQ